MANEVAVTTGKTLPSFLKSVATQTSALTNAIAALASGGFPYMSVKGKSWTIVRSGEATLLAKKDEDGDDVPAPSIEVVFVSSATNFSKVFYASGYTDGSKDKPTCHSENGVAPANDAQEPQAKKCAACPHNAFGSSNTGKGKACSDTLRMAIAAPDAINDAMLLRIPPGTLKNIAAYADECKRRGAPIEACITRLSFDTDEATPKIVFKFRRFVDEEQWAEIQTAAESAVVKNIIGAMSVAALPAPESGDAGKKSNAKPTVNADTEDDEDEAPAVKPAKKKPVIDDDDDVPAPKAKKKPAVDDDEDEAPVAKTTKKKPVVVSDSTKSAADAVAAKARAMLADDDDDDDA